MYKRAPAALVKEIEWSGLQGDVNHYLGVFFALERVRSGGTFPSATVTFGGAWADGDLAFLTMGETTIGKSVFPADTNDTIAAHFAYFLNETFSGVWASVSSNVLTITNRRHDHRQRLARKRSRGNVAGGRCSLDCAEPRGTRLARRFLR